MNSKNSKIRIFSFHMFLSAVLFTIAMLTEIAMADDKSDTLKIRWILEEALRANPGLESSKLRWSASTERIVQEMALDDPILVNRYKPVWEKNRRGLWHHRRYLSSENSG